MVARVITGYVEDARRERIPNAVLTIIPVNPLYGDGGTDAIIANTIVVTADGDGYATTTLDEGDYVVRVQTADMGRATRTMRVDTEGPWTWGRLLGLAVTANADLLAQISDLVAEARALVDLATGASFFTFAGGTTDPIVLPVEPANVLVFINGTLVASDDYTLTGDTITRATPWPVGDGLVMMFSASGSTDLNAAIALIEANVAAAQAAEDGAEAARDAAEAIVGSGNGQFPNGTAASPSITFASDLNTGLYRPAADQLAAATNGVLRWLLSTTAFQVNVPITGTAVTQSATDTTAGRLLTTGAGPDQAFRRGNILGTVSRSGGVPTGAVIERGSNANGEYVRFADGTQICWSPQLEFTAVTTVIGSGFRSDTVTWTFPAAFASATTLSIIPGQTGNVARWMAAQNPGTTSVGLRLAAWTSFAGAENGRCAAIGRWF